MAQRAARVIRERPPDRPDDWRRLLDGLLALEGIEISRVEIGRTGDWSFEVTPVDLLDVLRAGLARLQPPVLAPDSLSALETLKALRTALG